MRLAILYEDDEIFLSMTPEEFTIELQKHIDQGLSVKEAMIKIVTDLKTKTLVV